MRISSANTKGHLVGVRTTRIGRDIDVSDVKILTSERRLFTPCLGTTTIFGNGLSRGRV
jgi:hypothetical protein